MNIITSLGKGNNGNIENKPMSYEEIEKWAIEKMNKMLGIESKEMVKYVMAMDTNSEIQKYLEEVLGTTKKVQTFIEQLIKKMNALPRRVSKFQKVIQPPTNQTNNQKKKTTTTTTTTTTSSSGSGKIKQSITSFKEIQIEMRPGEPCECQATRHKLITNCLNCGKVICEQEGNGPCKFCSTPLFTNPSNLSLQQQQIVDKNLSNAVEYKDRILGYQNTHAKRTMVFDDQEDYFSNSTNKWLTEQERATVAKQEIEFKQKQEQLKKQNRIQIDFQGGRIISAPIDLKELEFEKLSFTNNNNESSKSNSSTSSTSNNNNNNNNKSIEEYKKDNLLGKDVKYLGKHQQHQQHPQAAQQAASQHINGKDDIITKQYYGVEDDIVVFNSKQVKSNSKLRYRGIIEGLWCTNTTTTESSKNSSSSKRLPSITTYIKYIQKLKDNGCNFISISPQNYSNEDFLFKNINSDESTPSTSKNQLTIPNSIKEFLKQLIDANNKISSASSKNVVGEEEEEEAKKKEEPFKINISILIPREFEFLSDSNFELMKNIIEMYSKILNGSGNNNNSKIIKSFSLILPSGWNDSFTLPIVAPISTKSEVNNSKSYSQTQTMFLTKLHQFYKSKNDSIEFIVCPSIFELNLNTGNPPRQQIEYWREISKATPQSIPLLFTTVSGSLQNSTLLKTKNIFDKRDLIVIEKYPYKNSNNSSSGSGSGSSKGYLPIQWDPYHCGFDDYKSYLSGIVASPFDSECYLDDQTTFMTLSTTFIQYLKSPFNYQSELALRASLIEFTDNNEEVADDLAYLIMKLPNGVFDQINSIVQTKLLEQKQQTTTDNNNNNIDARDKIFLENLINSITRVLDYFKNLPHDPLFDHLNLIKKTLLDYLN